MTARGIVTKRGRSNRKIRFDVSDVIEWEAVLISQQARIGKAARAVEQKNARELAARAQALAPRSSGYRSPASQRYGPLRLQIKATLRNQGSSVGIGNAFYGFFQEFGTSKMAPNPFFGPAIKKQRRPFKDDAMQAVQKILRRSGLNI